jgi:membrane fusion protein, multidrug efflux system
MRRKLLPGLFAGFLIAIGGCNQKEVAAENAPAQAAPPPTAVTSVTVAKENIPINFEYVGQIAGSLDVEIRSRITGIVEKQHFVEGSEVEASQLLFTLDDALFRAEYQQSLAAIESARAQKVTAEAKLKQAQRELKRVTPLAKQQMLSQNTQDDAESNVDIASANLVVAEAAIKEAEANLLTAKINLDYTRIRAPVPGVIGRALQNPGALVQAGSNSLLTTLVQINPVYVNFGIPENEWVNIRHDLANKRLVFADKTFKVDLLDVDNKTAIKSGTLDFQDYKVDSNNGNFAMRASIANDDKLLSPGQFVRVRLNGVYRPDAMAIPQRAVLDGPGGKYVYVATQTDKGMVALQKTITLGEWVDLDENRQNYWIVNSGLSEGDKVVVDGVARIFYPGAPIQLSDAQSTANPQ